MNIHQHRYFHYFILFILLFTGFFAFRQSMGDRQRQAQVVIVTVMVYCAWGIVHHALNHDLHWKVVVEYVAFAGAGLLLFLGLLTLS